MGTTVPPGNPPEQQHDSNPTPTDPRVAGRQPGQCPSWCRTDHDRHDKHSRYLWGEGPEQIAFRSSHHEADVAVVDNPGAGGKVYVAVKANDDLPDPDGLPTIEEPNAGATTIDLHGAECMEPATATAVAAATLEAVRVVEGTSSDPTDRQLVADLQHQLVTYRQLVDDLQGAIGEYELDVPAAHLRLILDKYHQRRGVQPAQRCRVCDEPVEHVACRDPYWRHLHPSTSASPHSAQPEGR